METRGVLRLETAGDNTMGELEEVVLVIRGRSREGIFHGEHGSS